MVAITVLLLVVLVSGGVLWWLLAHRPIADGPTAAGTTRLRVAVPEFVLTERSRAPVTRADLAGKVWIAGFVFTRCHGPCPLVTGVMARLRSELPTDVQLVTITVDPEHDTPEVLTEYARRNAVPEQGWWFLTGAKEPLYRLVREGFRIGVEEDADATKLPGERITHSTRLAVVDRAGMIRGYFEATDPASIATLSRMVAALRREAP
jgi:cytochrome oxidase Cu insertion factor (SCO1/SenC/PrrC family)